MGQKRQNNLAFSKGKSRPFSFFLNRIRERMYPIDGTILFIGFLSLFLRFLVPAAVAVNTPNDDYLGVMLARHLLDGKWLGPWNVNTLAKPPGYSFFLTFAHFIPVDPTLILHFLYLTLGSYFIFLFSKFLDFTTIPTKVITRLAYLIFAFNPSVYSNDFSRIYRISLDTISALLFVLLFLHLYINIGKEFSRLDGSRRLELRFSRSFGILATLLGIDYAIMILTRTEAYWILYPSIALILLLLGKDLFTRNKKAGFFRTKIIIFVKIMVVALVAFIIPITIVQQVNHYVYGVSEAENFYTGNFAHAINLWESVKNGKDARPGIAVSHGQRLAVYAVSPTAAKLESYLETAPNTGWKADNCATTHVCDEAGIWFPWGLRDAAVQAANINSERDFQNFFGLIAKDISLACADRQLECGSAGLAPGVVSLSDLQKRQLFDTSVRVLDSFFNFEQAARVERGDTGQDPTQLATWHSTVNFKYVIVNNDFNIWLVMGHTITFLRNVYIPLTYLLLFFSLIGLFWPKKLRKDQSRHLFIIYLYGTIAVYCGGLAIVVAGAGFSPGFTLYPLPVQPIFLIALLMGTGSTIAVFLKSITDE